MDKRIAGLLGAAAALTTVTAAHAAVLPPQADGYAPAASYRDLLDPVPDAIAALKADDARLAETPSASAKDNGVQVAQYHHHHHHHHHHVLPRPLRRVLHPRHHHHHHHHHRR